MGAPMSDYVYKLCMHCWIVKRDWKYEEKNENDDLISAKQKWALRHFCHLFLLINSSFASVKKTKARLEGITEKAKVNLRLTLLCIFEK